METFYIFTFLATLHISSAFEHSQTLPRENPCSEVSKQITELKELGSSCQKDILPILEKIQLDIMMAMEKRFNDKIEKNTERLLKELPGLIGKAIPEPPPTIEREPIIKPVPLDEGSCRDQVIPNKESCTERMKDNVCSSLIGAWECCDTCTKAKKVPDDELHIDVHNIPWTFL